MSGPKHLWSGDWENESRQPAAAPPPALEPEPEAAPAADEPTRGRYSRRQLVIALSAGVAAAAVTVALVVTLTGGQKPSPHHPATTASTAPGTPGKAQSSGGGGLTVPSVNCRQSGGCVQTTSVPTVSGPSANWMGMQIVTSPSGVVVNTVKLGSAADEAGFEPGDQIQSVNGRIIGTVPELKSDTDGVRLGGPVTVKVMRSSVQLTFASIRMTQRPSIHP